MEIKKEINKFLNKFVTELTHREIVDLNLDSKKEDELFDIFKEHKFVDFRKIELKYNQSVNGRFGTVSNRDEMIIENLDLEPCLHEAFYPDMHHDKYWCKEYLNFENGLIELTIRRSGKYEIIQQSRSLYESNALFCDGGSAVGVTVQLEMELAKVCY